MTQPSQFYDVLAGRYHLLFPDWWSAALEHGRVIHRLLSARGAGAGRLLDCTCGIGTQALPLALIGYDVTGTDVSSAAVERAGAEALARGIEVDLRVADLRDLRRHVNGRFDVVISCDNALPHLLTDDDLLAALRNVRECLRPKGLMLASLRDYDALRRDRPPGIPITVHGDRGTRHASSQAWRWAEDGDYVDIELFTLAETPPGEWRGASGSTRYRALRRATLHELLASAGFIAIEWCMPDVSGYYQPIVLCRAG